uniref:Uncharacterized protein n=1 Tax=Rhizophora mucronata TaxID=61149 RepID=A0A2P2ISZ2_RHIMU
MQFPALKTAKIMAFKDFVTQKTSQIQLIFKPIIAHTCHLPGSNGMKCKLILSHFQHQT